MDHFEKLIPKWLIIALYSMYWRYVLQLATKTLYWSIAYRCRGSDVTCLILFWCRGSRTALQWKILFFEKLTPKRLLIVLWSIHLAVGFETTTLHFLLRIIFHNVVGLLCHLVSDIKYILLTSLLSFFKRTFWVLWDQRTKLIHLNFATALVLTSLVTKTIGKKGMAYH